MNILLTGSTGMVGKNILECNAAFKHSFFTPSSSEMDLLNLDSVKHYLNQYDIDAVIHSAGLVGGIQANIKHPVDFFYNNMQMGLNIIKESHNQGIKKLINLGSSCMYPRNAPNPLREEMILQGELEPTNEGYALAKIGCAKLCNYIAMEDNTYSYRTLIPCNLFGRHDKFSTNNSHMIPAVIAKLHQANEMQAREVEIWGDGTARREFMYAGDLAEMVLDALRKIDALPQITNIGLGHDYSIEEYYEAIADVVGYNGNFKYDLTRPVGMKQKLVDVELMNSLNWTCRTPLKAGIEKTYKFFLEQL